MFAKIDHDLKSDFMYSYEGKYSMKKLGESVDSDTQLIQ